MAWNREQPYNDLPLLPPAANLDTTPVLKAVTESRVALARLDQATDLMPNPSVLINTIPLLEAQASSAIENIVTTTDALFMAASRAGTEQVDPAVKETLRYRTALRSGFESMAGRTLTARTAMDVCSEITGVDMDVRQLPGTRIGNPATGEVIYAPPEGADVIRSKLSNWEQFIHADDELDPIVRMAVSHYQFEAIHPFTDGNGRTGRIINILVLQNAGLLRLPVLYLSRHIIETKSDYYSLLNAVTANGEWEQWVLYLVEAVRQAAQSTTMKILAIRDLQQAFQSNYQHITPGMRDINFLNVLFSQPYCRIVNVVDACRVSRQTASAWLDALVREDVLVKVHAGRDRLFLNHAYLDLLARAE